MSRLTKKMMGKVVLPIMPMGIETKEDLYKYHEVRREYEDIAIKLAEYEDREEIKDCQYCCGDVDGRDYILSNGSEGIYIDGKGNFVGDDDFDFEDKRLNYCPVCGRKL
ncbi:TPA: hypothetical protein ACXDAM_000813 [Clostridium botulinum]|nr:hypothetical protein [Clostridium botulinum]